MIKQQCVIEFEKVANSSIHIIDKVINQKALIGFSSVEKNDKNLSECNIIMKFNSVQNIDNLIEILEKSKILLMKQDPFYLLAETIVKLGIIDPDNYSQEQLNIVVGHLFKDFSWDKDY